MRSHYRYSECDLEHIGYEYTTDSDGSITLSVCFEDLGCHALKQDYVDHTRTPLYFCRTLPYLFHKDMVTWVKIAVLKGMYK